jgi:MarR family transcriptional regulator, temperature-dependent positive regulator of motility
MKAQGGSRLTRENLGFLLAKALQRWNSSLYERLREEGFGHVRPSFGSLLIPLFEEDGLRLGELARRGGISKQTMTTMVRQVEDAGLIRRKVDEKDARAVRVFLTAEARRFEPVADKVLAELDQIALSVDGAAGVERTKRWLRKFVAG